MFPSGLFDDGQEYKYSYLAFTTTGVRDPAPTGSSFGISGKVVVQKKNGELIVKVTSKPSALTGRAIRINHRFDDRLTTLNSVCTTALRTCWNPCSSSRNPNWLFWRNHSNFLTPTERYCTWGRCVHFAVLTGWFLLGAGLWIRR